MSPRIQEIPARLHVLDAERKQITQMIHAPVFRDAQTQSYLERILIGLQLEAEGLAAQLRVYEETEYPHELEELYAMASQLSEPIDRRAMRASKARR